MNNQDIENLPEDLKKALIKDRDNHIQLEFQKNFNWQECDLQIKSNKKFWMPKITALAASFFIALLIILAVINAGNRVRKKNFFREHQFCITPGAITISGPGNIPFSVSSGISKINLYNAGSGVSITTTGLKPTIEEMFQ